MTIVCAAVIMGLIGLLIYKTKRNNPYSEMKKGLHIKHLEKNNEKQ